MRLYEFESKKIFEKNNIPIPKGQVVYSVDEITAEIPSVIKAQIPSGGRGKAGGVLFSKDLKETKEMGGKLLGSTIKNFPVNKLLIEEQISLENEFFMAVTYDTTRKLPVVIFSTEGGVDIEELARTKPEKIVSRNFDILIGFQEHHAREIVADAGIRGNDLVQISSILYRLIQVFLKFDATLAEINPLGKTKEGKFVALDGHIEIDDDALYRHKDITTEFGERDTQARKTTEFEKKASEIDKMDHRGVAGRMIEFDGNLGLLIGGGGASLTSFDAIKKYGGKPANYCEIGGNPSVFKVKELVKLILSKKGINKIAVIMNVVSNTRVDLVARGVIKGVIESGKTPSETITVFRIPGAWEDEGFKILKKYGVPYCDRTVSIDEAARMAVERASKG